MCFCSVFNQELYIDVYKVLGSTINSPSYIMFQFSPIFKLCLVPQFQLVDNHTYLSNLKLLLDKVLISHPRTPF